MSYVPSWKIAVISLKNEGELSVLALRDKLEASIPKCSDRLHKVSSSENQ